MLHIEPSVRRYTPEDLPGCLALLASNTPRYFLPSDGDEYTRFLTGLPGPYYVLESDNAVLAAGGWAMEAEGVAVLTWGMVDAAWHRRGIGAFMVRYRLDALRQVGSVGEVRLNTIPAVQGFYEKLDFCVFDVVRDGFGPGLDRVAMRRIL